jgi:hypothetical protein
VRRVGWGGVGWGGVGDGSGPRRTWEQASSRRATRDCGKRARRRPHSPKRTLAAADNAVMLVDGAKGIEEQTRKLFAVARLKGLPIFTVGTPAARREPHPRASRPAHSHALFKHTAPWPHLWTARLAHHVPSPHPFPSPLPSSAPPPSSTLPAPLPLKVVNKMDRPALNGFEIIEQLEKEFGLASFPVTWPIGSGDRFCGLYHRPSRKVRAEAIGKLSGSSREATLRRPKRAKPAHAAAARMLNAARPTHPPPRPPTPRSFCTRRASRARPRRRRRTTSGTQSWRASSSPTCWSS